MNRMTAWLARRLEEFPVRIYLGLVAVLFGFGAAVHVANILGLSGYQWASAPMSWRIFDIVFLALDLSVVAAVMLRSGWSIPLVLVTCGLQIVLYAFFADRFSQNSDQAAAIRHLLYLNLALAGTLLFLLARRRRHRPRLTA